MARKATLKQFWNSVFNSAFCLNQNQFEVVYFDAWNHKTILGPMCYWLSRTAQHSIVINDGMAYTYLRQAETQEEG